MSFIVELDKRAERELDNLDPPIRTKVIGKLKTLEEKPYETDGNIKEKIKGKENLYELKRPHPYRIIYSIEDQRVIVKSIIHRSELHRSLGKL